MTLEGILGDGKGALEALKDIIGKRTFWRRTDGSEARTRLHMAMWAMHEVDPELGTLMLSKVAAECHAGEHGADTKNVIEAVSAAAKVRVERVEDGKRDSR